MGSVFKEGDFVVVAGLAIQNDGQSTCNRTIASVVAVGEHDMFLKCFRSGKLFKRPKLNCSKLPPPPARFKRTTVPSLGDLVLSCSGGMFREQKTFIGILIEVIDRPPDELQARILSGEETHVVAFDSLIVVEGR